MPTAPPARRTVWVVDDSPVDAERARRALEGVYSVEIFLDGAAALERLSGGVPPDVLVCDWVMPEVSGLEVVRFLRESRGPLAQVPVLLLTARQDSDQVVEGLSAGANDYVSKPYAEAELKVRVSNLMRARALLERAEGAEAMVSRLLAAAPDALLALDVDGKVTYANDEALRTFARPAAKVVGRTVRELVPELATATLEPAPGEGLTALPDVKIGAQVYAPVLRRLPDAEYGAAITLSFRDVTERRRDEARRLDFYSIIAHDLRSPLSTILLRTEMIFRGKHGILPAGLLLDMRKIESNVRSMIAMINDFLDLARLEGSGYKLDREPLDLAELLRTSVEDLRPLLDASRLSARSELPIEAISIVGDPRRLGQVLSNLLGNAIKFTPAGGRITVRAELLDQDVEVSVEDTGRGIAPEVLPTLFQRYARALDTQHEVSGTGLGLMIVREIVEAHGGTVGVESHPGEGSRFWFRLPRALDVRADREGT